MNVIKCSSCGRHYDADRYNNVCCFCKTPVANTVETASKESWGFRRKKKEKAPTVIETKNDTTVGMYGGVNDISRDVEPDDGFSRQVESDVAETPKSVPVQEVKPETVEKKDVSSLMAEKERVLRDNSEGKTVGFFGGVISGKNQTCINENANIDMSAKSTSRTDPVVGWLVAVQGAHTGESFIIRSGNNTIGRSSVNDIVISGDGQVSREKHAHLIYDFKKRDFYLKPGDGQNTYCNDDIVLEHKKLNNYDTLEIGGSKLVFISLCGEKFAWENYL